MQVLQAAGQNVLVYCTPIKFEVRSPLRFDKALSTSVFLMLAIFSLDSPKHSQV